MGRWAVSLWVVKLPNIMKEVLGRVVIFWYSVFLEEISSG